MKIGTAELGSTFFTQGVALAEVLRQADLGQSIEVVKSTSASIENARSISNGKIDYGFMAANWIGMASRGAVPFDAPIDLRMVAPMNLGPMFFIVRRETQIETVADLRGKRVCVGPAGSGVEQHARSIFGALGMSFKDFFPINLDFAAGAEALAKGKIDAQLQCPIPNKVMAALDTSVDLRVLAYAPGDLQKVLDRNTVYRRTTMHRGALRALDADVEQPGVVNVLVTSATQPAAEVAAVVRAIVAGAEELARRDPLFIGIADLWKPLKEEGDRALTFEGVPLHDGARAGYRSAGVMS